MSHVALLIPVGAAKKGEFTIPGTRKSMPTFILWLALKKRHMASTTFLKKLFWNHFLPTQEIIIRCIIEQKPPGEDVG